jgi:hypothetical protein
MPCYRCGVRQTDPSRGQSPWKRGVVQHSQILICPGCQDAADWTADLDRCSRCSSVHLVKRLGEVECRDCGTIVPPEPSGETGLAGTRDLGPGGAGLAGPGAAGSDAAGWGSAGSGPGSGSAGSEGAGRGPDLSEEVARALDRVLGRSLVSQSIQRAPDPGGKAGSGSRAGAGTAGSRPGGSGTAGSGAAGSGSGAAGRHRPSRPEAGHHATAHPGAERHRAARPGRAGADAASLDVIRPGAFAG